MRNIPNTLDAFYKKIKLDPNHRYLSWEHCYLFFRDYKKLRNDPELLDYACLQLGFYLASWGMLRGSSFLLWKDYKFYKNIILTLIKPIYDELWDFNPLKSTNKQIDLLMALRDDLDNTIVSTAGKIDNSNRKVKVSDTLSTKIMMGTLGCTPAFDRFFISGLKKSKFKSFSFNKKAFNELIAFYRKNEHEFEKVKLKVGKSNLNYPPMKHLDMYFWIVGEN